jgi:high-affinity iron transporter
MLPTFVIGLREGLEAALIVGIIAAFLRQAGQRSLLRWVFAGVALAVGICLAGGIALKIVSEDLPQRQQEGLETVVGAIAVAMVTYMVVWMRKHARDMKGQLEGATADALATGSGKALVMMAFLAVLREGFETVVFLLAAFNESGNPTTAGTGALLGILVAVALGWGIYRGGVKLNLSKFFRATGLVLVLVAAGLVVTALHTAHEAGWLNAGQQRTVDLTAIVRPGSVQSSLLTGMLGIQPNPVLIEVAGWLVYLIPVGLYVSWPPGRGMPRFLSSRWAYLAVAATGAAALILAVVAPGIPAKHPVTRSGAIEASVVSSNPTSAVIRATVLKPVTDSAATDVSVLTAKRTEAAQHGGLRVEVYSVTTTSDEVPGRPATITYADVAKLNGGRLPLGVRSTDVTSGAPVAVTYAATDAGTFWVEPRTGRVIDLQWRETVYTNAKLSIGLTQLGSGESGVATLPSAAATAAGSAVHHDLDTIQRHQNFISAAIICAVVAVFLLLLISAAWLGDQRRRADVTRISESKEQFVGS